MSQSHHALTSALKRGLSRATRLPSAWCGRRRLTWTSTLQPREQPVHTDLAVSRYHTRTWKRKSRPVSAPTGQLSTTLAEQLLTRTRPGNRPIYEWSPRLKIPSSPVQVISSHKREQREQSM